MMGIQRLRGQKLWTFCPLRLCVTNISTKEAEEAV